jgi:hypothetical protein
MPQLPSSHDFTSRRAATVQAAQVAGSTPDEAGAAAFHHLQQAVRLRILAGNALSQVEDELIDPANVSADKKAALWLLAWSLLPPSYQLAEVEAHIELLCRAG